MNAFVNSTLPGLLLGLLFKSACLLLLAGAACLLLRRASAATRHLVWSSALGGLLLLPVLMLALPHWNLAVRRATTQVLPPVTGPSPAVGKPPSSPPRDGEGEPMATGEQSSQGSPAANGGADGKPLSSSFTPRDRRPFPLRGGGRSLATGGEAGRILPLLVELVWLLGVVVLLARLAVGLRRVELIRRRAVPLEAATLALAESLHEQFPLRRTVTFLRASVGSGVSVPLTWGGRRPNVLLPEQSGAWPADTCRAALLHELAHVARWDWTTQTLARLACALYWVNPLVWLAAREARAESERACDDCVLQAGLSAADYAQNLVDVVRSMPPGPPVRTAAIAMAQPSEVESRLRALLAKGRNRRPLTRKLVLGMLAVFLMIALPLAALRLVAQAQIPLTTADATQPAPGGGTVRLVGISNYPSAQGTWWGKDGVRLPHPPAESLDHNIILGKAPAGQRNREILLETFGTNPEDNFTIKTSPEPSGGSGISISSQGTHARVGCVGAFSVAQMTCTVRVGIAHTPWRTLMSDTGLPTGGGGGMGGSANGISPFTVSFSPPSEIKGKTAFTVSDDVKNLPTRIVAIDRQGRTVEGNETGGDWSSGNIHQRTVTFPALALKDIKELQLQWRPYDWIEFKNVPLQPVTTSDTANGQGENRIQGEGTSPLRTVAPTTVGAGFPRPVLLPRPALLPRSTSSGPSNSS